MFLALILELSHTGELTELSIAAEYPVEESMSIDMALNEEN